MVKKTFSLQKNVSRFIDNGQLRRNLRFSMDTMKQTRAALFSDKSEFETLRKLGQSIRQRSLDKLPELLVQLEEKCTANGIRVHWAETVDDANQIVLDVINQHGGSRLVKGKSMVSEEMHLNSFLADHGLDPIETDLGEFIIQLAGETPSHIIVPAIHKNKAEIADLFHKKIPDTPYTEEVEELNAIARKTLRQKFFEAEIGISGVNMAVAETGTLCLVENEGNGRMCTTLPPVHIAVMGLEKVVEKLVDVPPLMRLLTASATGQPITTYVNMITSPRKPGEKDGPREIHLIILDNKRSKILADPQLRQTLQCIRCGTCLSHCPVYTRIGGHAYGFVYPGPIGTILTPQIEGLKNTNDLINASSLCNACEEVCPVKIPIPDLIRRLRNESMSNKGSVEGAGTKRALSEMSAWKAWKLINRHAVLNRLSGKAAAAFGKQLKGIGPLKAWTSCRTLPKFARKSMLDLADENGVSDE